eukprot:349946-Chlamydomonas_euryale.AAC.1
MHSRPARQPTHPPTCMPFPLCPSPPAQPPQPPSHTNTLPHTSTHITHTPSHICTPTRFAAISSRLAESSCTTHAVVEPAQRVRRCAASSAPIGSSSAAPGCEAATSASSGCRLGSSRST